MDRLWIFELFRNHVFSQQRETRQESCNEIADVINWRNNDRGTLLRDDIRVNSAKCNRYSYAAFIAITSYANYIMSCPPL